MPNRNQLITEIASKNDDVDYRLILRTDGKFELVGYYSESQIMGFDDMDYVTRWETFDEGNKYVGVEASRDSDYIDQIMEWANKTWSTYTQTGKTKITNKHS